MNCKEFKELIPSALDGELDGDVADRFEAHRKSCSTCSKEYNRHRRIRLCMRYFPTVVKVDEGFRKELIERIAKESKVPSFKVNLVAVFATLLVFGSVFVGLMFSVKAYNDYLFREKIFIARYERGARSSLALSQLTGGTRQYPLDPKEPVFILNLMEVSSEGFVIRLLARYEEGKVPDSLVRSILVDTGILDGAKMRWINGGVLDPLAGRSRKAEIIFARQLPQVINCALSGDDIFELKKFALDLISTFGGYLPLIENDNNPAFSEDENFSEFKLYDITRIEESTFQLDEEKLYSVLILLEDRNASADVAPR